jgi:hypothetical protein
LWVDRAIGWQRVMQGLGLLAGGLGGGLFGFVIGWWAIIPVFIGLFLGARKGMLLGSKIWAAGLRYGWERIWAVLSAGAWGLAGWLLLSWIASGGIGVWAQGLAGAAGLWLSQYLENPLLLEWTLPGALAGAFGGAISGALTDLFARLSGLVD